MSKFTLPQFFLLLKKVVFNSIRFKQEMLKEKWIINIKIMLQTAMNTLVINIINILPRCITSILHHETVNKTG